MNRVRRAVSASGLVVALGARPASASTPAAAPDTADHSAAVATVTARERAFAATMAERDFERFLPFISPEAVFLNGGKPLVGRAAVGAGWRAYFDGPRAPFSWMPEIVVVLASGRLACSEGPVRNAEGVLVARFISTWRREDDGEWRVVFDNGYKVCP